MPTEAERKRADRGSSDTRLCPWGDEAPNFSRLDYRNSSSYCVRDTSHLGTYPSSASRYGAMNLSGNLFEWVNDWYLGDYYSGPSCSNPPGPVTEMRKVLHGDGFLHVWGSARAAALWYSNPSARSHDIGFWFAVAGPGE